MSKPKEVLAIDVPEEVIADLMTESEVRMIKNRWRVVILLGRGLSVRAVAEKVSVGTDTVVRMSKLLRTNGIVRQRAKEVKIVEPEVRVSGTSKWVFGKVGGEE